MRIAPSPTGDPHVGTAYIALFNYVFARNNGGHFVLRIEDTDQSAVSARQSEAAILRACPGSACLGRRPGRRWPTAPYRQSERPAIHHEHALRLVDSGKAPAPSVPQSAWSSYAKSQREAGMTWATTACVASCPGPADGPGPGAQGEAQHPPGHADRRRRGVEDASRGAIDIDNQRIDDQVLLKSDGSRPTTWPTWSTTT